MAGQYCIIIRNAYWKRYGAWDNGTKETIDNEEQVFLDECGKIATDENAIYEEGELKWKIQQDYVQDAV